MNKGNGGSKKIIKIVTFLVLLNFLISFLSVTFETIFPLDGENRFSFAVNSYKE